ncbi:hypothetical protein ADN00_12290 [Ornatilinea apprima]|uniref:Immunity MXAN-0049 protein domain-containing protein n=1 Tax=Ornatilinea apprima TaxID=1134406 RepID=A0A0P6X188_9CHLR|nr:DUF1629 domain-containing protein [Ornatilinea apprima]KPL76113.1 hypothetical protein ADN00_12290 [Ornatilinea apprima]
MKKSQSQFYELIFDGYAIEDNPLSIYYERRDDQGFDNRLLNRGNSLEDLWPQDFTIYLRGYQPVDYLMCGPGYEVLSKSAADIFHSIAKDSIELLPVNTVINDQPVEPNSFFVLNVLKSFEALNWEETVWSSPKVPYDDPSAHGRIIKPAFNIQLIQEEAIFLLSVQKKIKSGIYISRYLKESLEERNSTIGMAFTPIKVVIQA